MTNEIDAKGLTEIVKLGSPPADIKTTFKFVLLFINSAGTEWKDAKIAARFG